MHELEEMKVETLEGFHGFLDAVSIPNGAIFKIRFEDERIWFSSIFGSYLPKDLRAG